MNEKEMVRRNVVIAVGIICMILAACLVGAFASYILVTNDKNNTISSLNSQMTNLQNQIQSDNSTINSLNSQIVELENQLASDNSTFASNNATIAILQNQISELSSDISSLQSQYEQLNQTYTSSFLFSSSKDMRSPYNWDSPQIFIAYPAGFQEYANAILKICEQAMTDYSDVFYVYNGTYFDRPSAINIFIYTNVYVLSLSTLPWYYRIYLFVPSIKDMAPPNITGIHWVYGFIHELGHITFFTDNDNFSEGWAHYATAFRILPEVYSQLGDDAWPQPYNYSQTEGPAWFLNGIQNSSLTTPGTEHAAAKILYTIDQKYGPLIFKKAMNICHPTPRGFYDYPIYSLDEFKNALVSLTNDTSLLQLFKENGF